METCRNTQALNPEQGGEVADELINVIHITFDRSAFHVPVMCKMMEKPRKIYQNNKV